MGGAFGSKLRLIRSSTTFFNDAMASDARLVTKVLLEKCGAVFEGLESIVDVGGGTGTTALAIAKAFPDLSCINFDLPHVVAGLEGFENIEACRGGHVRVNSSSRRNTAKVDLARLE
ncbi:unnamed protein product [Rhodiola kirilowii]